MISASRMGCNDVAVQACVCELDSYCCSTAWDAQCAAEAKGCGSCTGDCCAAHGNPGCDDGAVVACVCAADPYCCETAWDQYCVDEVTSGACGLCGGAADDSCDGFCGGQAPGGCWCDTGCADYGDCCADLATFCP